MCFIHADSDFHHGLDLKAATPQQRKALERRHKQRLRKRYFRALEVGREPPRAALSMGQALFHQTTQQQLESESWALGSAAGNLPLVQTVDAVVMNMSQMSCAPCSLPSTAQATPPIHVADVEQALCLQPVSLAPSPMLLCAVQDVQPLMEHMVVPMVVMDAVPSVPKQRQCDDVTAAEEMQLKDVSCDLPVAAVSKVAEQAPPPHDCHLKAGQAWTQEMVLPSYTVKNTFIEVEESLADDGTPRRHRAGDGARQRARAQSLPARNCCWLGELTQDCV